jgi:hypothetical protein
VQGARVAHDPWEDLIEQHLSALPDKTKGGEDTVKDGYAVGINDNGEREWRVASGYLLGPSVLGIEVKYQTNANTKRLAEVMRTLGWTKPTQTIRVGKKPCRGFTKPIVELAGPVEEPKVIAVAEAEPKPRAVVVVRKPWLRPL